MEKGPDLDSMSREELIGLVRSLLLVASEVHALRAKLTELEGKLALNSSNSSLPPSSDFPKPRPAEPRAKGARLAGAQKGHPGSTLRQVAAERLDWTVSHAPQARSCEACGRFLPAPVDAGLPRRQVLDLPALAFEATEHVVLSSICRCGKAHLGAFPERVGSPVQYGPRLAAAAALLGAWHMVPVARAAKLLSDLSGLDVSAGFAASAVAAAAERVRGAAAEIGEACLRSEVCRRRSNSEPLCRPNNEPGRDAVF